MASYYTYGAIPDSSGMIYEDQLGGLGSFAEPEEDRLYVPRGEDVPVAPLESSPGPGLGGDEPVYTPRGEDVPVTPLASAAPPPPPVPAPQGALPTYQPKATTDTSALAAGAIPSSIQNYALYAGKMPSSMTDLTKFGSAGADLESGNLYEKLRADAIASHEQKLNTLSKLGMLNPETKQSLDSNLQSVLSSMSELESEYVSTLPQRRELSSLLSQNKFEDAYKYAMDNNLQRLLLDPTELSNLRNPFSKEESRDFINKMPSSFFASAYGEDPSGKNWEFDPKGAEDRGALSWITQGPEGATASESGFPNLVKVAKTPELPKLGGTSFLGNVLKAAAVMAAIYTGGAALGAWGGGAGAAGAGAAGAGAGAAGSGAAGGTGALSGIKSAYQAVAAIPGKIGGTVANALGLPIQSTIAKTAFGNSLISGATTAAKGGDLGDVIKSGLIAAGVTYGLDAAVNAVKGMMPDISNAVGNEVSNAAAASNVPTSSALDALQEVVITAKKVSDVAGLGGAATGAATAPSPKKSPLEEAAKPEDLEEVTVTGKRVVTPPIVTKPPLQEVGKIETTKPEPKFEPAPTVDDLQEIEVTGKRVPLPPVAISPPVAPPSPIETPFEPAPTVDDLQEIEVTGKRVPVPPIVVTPPPAPLETPFEPAPTVDDLQEIEVTGKRVELPPLAITQPTGPIDTAFEPAPMVDDLQEIEVTGKRTKPYIPEPPPIVISPSDILKDYKPTQVPEDSTLKKILEKYGTLENFMKLLGALGAGAAKGPKMPTGGLPTGGGMGGALPKYTYTRQQLSPDIDYYTYGTRPEAKFFEQGLKLEQPQQTEPPQGPPSKPPGDEPVFAAGGLTGYARGGSKKSRYVAGPGSGRDDKIPALLSDGEYVIDAETLALLGDGSTKEGARRMDKFRAKIRKHKGRALSRGRISPNAKSPDKYMGGGLT